MAGQYGAGFKEVRKLSSETATATEQIETSLKRLRVIFKHLWKAWSKLKQPLMIRKSRFNNLVKLLKNLNEI